MPIFLSTWTRIAAVMIGIILLLMAVVFLGAPNWIAVLILVYLFLFTVLSAWRLRFYKRLLDVYRTAEPMTMYIHMRKHIWGDAYRWYAELRYPESSAGRVDIYFPVIHTDWITQIRHADKVRVYGGAESNGYLVETKMGLLWPNGPFFFLKKKLK